MVALYLTASKPRRRPDVVTTGQSWKETAIEMFQLLHLVPQVPIGWPITARRIAAHPATLALNMFLGDVHDVSLDTTRIQ